MATPPAIATPYNASKGGSPVNASAASTNDCSMAKPWTHDQQLALVAAVGDEPGPGAEHEHRQELAGGEHADGDAVVVGQMEHEQRLSDQGQPVADLRHELAAEEQAEVADLERAQRVVEPDAESLAVGSRVGAALGDDRFQQLDRRRQLFELMRLELAEPVGRATPCAGRGCTSR